MDRINLKNFLTIYVYFITPPLIFVYLKYILILKASEEKPVIIKTTACLILIIILFKYLKGSFVTNLAEKIKIKAPVS